MVIDDRRIVEREPFGCSARRVNTRLPCHGLDVDQAWYPITHASLACLIPLLLIWVTYRSTPGGRSASMPQLPWRYPGIRCGGHC